MSLDVYLIGERHFDDRTGIFIRENGAMREISREEWDRRFPGTEPVIAEMQDDEYCYSDNITHNLTKMADAAGLYKALWRPEEIGATHAHQLVAPIETGLAALKADPERFKALNPPNGWGSYAGLVGFAERYLMACKAHPSAKIEVSR